MAGRNAGKEVGTKKKKKKLRKSLYKYAGDIELTFGEFMFDFMLDVEDDSEKLEKFFIQE